MEPKAPKAPKVRQKAIQKKQTNVLGRHTSLGGLGLQRVFGRFMLKFANCGATLDAPNHSKSIQKHIPKKNKTNIKNHDLLMRKNIEIHCKHNCF